MSALTSQCAEHSSDEKNFVVSGKMCSGIVILDLELAQERQDNRHQHLIHVRLTDKVSPLNPPDYHPRFFNISRGTVLMVMHEKPMFEPYIEIMRK